MERKERITFLVCTNAAGCERLAQLVISKARKPGCFEGLQGWQHEPDYWSSKKARMTKDVFFPWLTRLDIYVSKLPGRRAVLAVDNASSHGTTENLLTRHCVKVVFFLPKSTTSHVQPVDAGVIACVKRRYRRWQIERAVDLLDECVRDNVYNADINLAIATIYDIWQRLQSSVIVNYWRKVNCTRVCRYRTVDSVP